MRPHDGRRQKPRSQYEHAANREPHHVVCIGDYNDPAITTITTTTTKSTTTTATFAAGTGLYRSTSHSRPHPTGAPTVLCPLPEHPTTATNHAHAAHRQTHHVACIGDYDDSALTTTRKSPTAPAGYRSAFFTAAPDRRADHVVPGWNVCRCSWAVLPDDDDDDDGYDAADNFHVAGVRTASFVPTETSLGMTVTRC